MRHIDEGRVMAEDVTDGGWFPVFRTSYAAECRYCGKEFRARSDVDEKLLRLAEPGSGGAELARAYADCVVGVAFERKWTAHERSHWCRRVLAWVWRALS